MRRGVDHLSQFTGHTLSLRLIPNRVWLALGPGWAALAGVLASGQFRFEADILFEVALLWLLADPILGTIWHLLADRDLWGRLARAELLPGARVRRWLPYTARGSASYQASVLLANLSALPGGEGYTLLITALLAFTIGLVLGAPFVLYAVISVTLAGITQGHIVQGELRRLLQSVALFLLPFGAGLQAMKNFPLYALLFGGTYWVIYIGVSHLLAGRERGARLVVLGQGVAALLLFSLGKPLVATPLALATVFALLLRQQAQVQAVAAAPVWYAQRLRPFLWLGLFTAAIAPMVG